MCNKGKIVLPKRPSELAEFIGIVLGDGSISVYQVILSFGTEADSEYADFVGEFAARIFGISFGRVYRKESKTVNIVLSSVALVEFLQNQGLRIGNKITQQVDLPAWIYDHPEHARACLRGLMDTDGRVFHHRYQVNGKWYQYVNMGFTNHFHPLSRERCGCSIFIPIMTKSSMFGLTDKLMFIDTFRLLEHIIRNM